MIRPFQKVRLKTGEKAIIVEVLSNGQSFLADVIKDDGDYENDEITINDICGVFEEVERKFAV